MGHGGGSVTGPDGPSGGSSIGSDSTMGHGGGSVTGPGDSDMGPGGRQVHPNCDKDEVCPHGVCDVPDDFAKAACGACVQCHLDAVASETPNHPVSGDSWILPPGLPP